ncbi:MAG TPA: TRIC cation channel family protein [Methanospirillum sp.]|nr:TRIC cation channel family protein [Methanospirillum sp.]
MILISSTDLKPYLVIQQSRVCSEIMEPDISEFLLLFQTFIQWVAIILSASTGVYDARRHDLDYFGALVIAIIVAVGGGTLRDILLDRYPLFWLQDPIYLISILIVGIIGILLIPISNDDEYLLKNRPGRRFFHPVIRVMFGTSASFHIIDAVSLGMWAYLGTYYALTSGVPFLIAPVMGVITASFGGVIRDVLFAKIPELFRPSQFYALASCAGACAYVVCWIGNVPYPFGFIACMVITVTVRVASMRYNITSF